MEKIIQLVFWLRRRSFFRVTQRTLVMLMPVATIGAYFQLFHDAIFSPNSLIYNIFDFDEVLSDPVWDMGNAVTSAMMRVTLGVFGIYAAYFAAEYTARLYHKDATMAGITATMVILFCAYLSSGNRSNAFQATFYSRLINVNGVLISLVTGYFIGQIFHWLGKDYHHVSYENLSQIRLRAWNSLLPAAVAILAGLILGGIIYYFDWHLLDSSTIKSFVAQLKGSNNLAVVIPLTMLATFAWWCGVGYPLTSLMTASNSGAAVANLNYALRRGNASYVPFPFLGSSLTSCYGLMGDACIAMSLTVLLLLYGHHEEKEKVAKVNLLPVTFGTQSGLSVGLPLILNPLYLLPVVLIPAINELLAAGAISLQLIKPGVYPVLDGTPGLLISFFGTNGNWASFIFTLLLFALDIFLLLPVVWVERKVREEIRERNEQKQIKA